MRLLKKLLLKFIIMVVTLALMGAVMRFARPHIMKSAGIPEGVPGAEKLADAHFSSEESDLMATVFKSALRLFTGSAKRNQLAGELSDKLYAGRPGSEHMAELGIEIEKPGAKPSPAIDPVKPANFPSEPMAPGTVVVTAQPGAQWAAKTGTSPSDSPAKTTAPAADSPKKRAANGVRDALLGRVWDKVQKNPELSLFPVVLAGMLVVHFCRRRRPPEDDFVLPDLSKLLEVESGPHDMQHPVHALPAEEFEMLVAMVYQRQGYRVTMPAGLGGGRGGDFTVQKKSERLLVQCRQLRPDDEVSVERVRELHEAAVTAGATRGVYVASGNFSWDARNFAKVKGVTVINARILDALLAEALPKEDVLAVSQWAPKLMSKVKLTPPLCAACEAPMDEVTSRGSSVWLCSQRPDCRGRRSARKSVLVLSNAAAIAAPRSKPVAATKPIAPAEPPRQKSRRAKSSPPETKQGRARTIVPAGC
jgi:hypothetical protein